VSLIDEALKRAQAAHQEEKKREERARPWSPAPLPDRRRMARARARRTVTLVLASVGLVATGVFSLRRSLLRTPLAHPMLSVQKSPSVTDLPPIASQVVVSPPPKGLSSSARDRVLPAPTSAPPPLAQRRPPPAVLAEPPSSSSSGPALARPSPPPAAAAISTREQNPRGLESRTYAAEMPLPGGGKITLDGIAYSETNPVAVLDGRVVAAGGYVEGFILVRILPDRVELEKDGAKFFLTLH